MSLQFLNPIYLLGLLGVVVPVLVHLLTRRRQQRLPFSAVYLLHQAQQRSIRRARPNRLWLLLFRCLGIACLSLALASPLFSSGDAGGLAPGGPAANVFILDDSYSMVHQALDGTVFQSGQEVLISLLKNFPGPQAASLVLASSPARVIQDWTADTDRLVRQVRALSPSYQTTNIGQAVSLAADLLVTAPHPVQRVFLLTDLDKNGWRESDFPSLKDFPVEMHLLDFSGLREGANRSGVEQVEVSQEFLTHSRMVKIKSHIRNFSTGRSLNRLAASLWVEGKQQTAGWLDVAAGEVGKKEFVFPHVSKEPLQGYFEIQEDALSVDNRRFFTYQPDLRIRVLLVDGDPGGVSHQNETFYVERAMNPFSSPVADIEPVVSTLREFPNRDLRRFSVVVLCNVRELPFGFEQELERFVGQGGALFVSLGDQVDAKYYNEKLGGLLPVTLKALNQVEPGEESFRLETIPSRHPVLKVFSGKSLQEMGHIRVHSFFRLEPKPRRPLQTPVRLTNGAPLVVESEFGRGKVILFASSLDRDWNNFPIQPTFLPWMQRWTKYAARSLETITQQDLLVGDSIELEAGEGRYFIATPAGRAVEVFPHGDGKIRFDQTQIPGAYALYRAPKAPAAATETAPLAAGPLPGNAERKGSFTVNIDTAESLPGKILETDLRDLLRGMQVLIFQDPAAWTGASPEEGVPLTTPFLVLLALVLGVEGWMVRRE